MGKTDIGAHLRPTTDRVRENLFNLISGGKIGNRLAKARVLDLFTGTGALALEALSRGASSIWMLDNGAKSAALVQKNIALFETDAEVVFKKLDATRLPICPTDAFDLIFLDPPFASDLLERALVIIEEKSLLKADGLLYLEHEKNRKIELNACWQVKKEKVMGQVVCRLLGLA